MKVGEGQGAPEGARQLQGGAPSERKGKPFDRVLEEKSGAKAGEKSESRSRPDNFGPNGTDLFDPAAAIASRLPGPAVGGVDAKPAAGCADAIPLQQLVQEIAAVSRPDGRSSVDIQFDSRVLEGLHVRVAGEGNGVSIQFTAASDQVARLLSGNVDALAQALQAKGVRVAGIEIQTVPTVRAGGEPARERRDSGRGGGRQQGGGRNRS